MTTAAASPAQRRCPLCDGVDLRRVPRRPEDRSLGTAPALRRYRCRAAACSWEGLLTRRGSSNRSASKRQRRWLKFAPWLLAAFGVLAIGAFAVVLGSQNRAPVGWQTPPPGQSFDGDPLPVGHPLLTRSTEAAPSISTGASQSRPSAAADEPAARPEATATRLQLRRHCAWGQPGRSPYRGTPEQAMVLAQLPPEVVRRIDADIRTGNVTDRLTITNASIRADSSKREFDPGTVAMTYGHTLCLGTRVNFEEGHAERADLYEATAADGRVYAVMVPHVCGNVSVLGQRAERLRRAPAGGAQTADDAMRRLPDALMHADDDGRRFASAEGGSRSVPEPATLGLVLAGLMLLAVLRRRR